MADLRKLTILHSNDMHGDFLSEEKDGTLSGGVSMLSGYINKVRSEEQNVIYCIAGDMFRGSVIDSEFQGISTIDFMNLLAPDVVSLGNHEMDYGISHLLFLEKCAKFPIVNSNIKIKTTGMPLFDSHLILEVGGMKILFIGIITEDIMSNAKSDMLLGTFVNVDEAAEGVGRIVNLYKTTDIDFTVLLTHIGFEEDKKLAALLDPVWGVDVIVGGHSHTFPKEPAKVNDVLIVQAGTGTDCIGRFDITVDCDTNSVHDYTWELVPITPDNCPRDEALEACIMTYKNQTDSKYGRVLTHFDRVLTHPHREMETELGNLITDAIHEQLGMDITLIGSGSIRKPELGPIVTLQDLLEIYPYKGKIYSVPVFGSDLKTMVRYLCREGYTSIHSEFYQVSNNVSIVYDYDAKEIQTFTINGVPVEDERVYHVAIQDWHYNNITKCFGIPEENIRNYGHNKVITTSDFDLLEEYFNCHAHLTARIDNRFTVLNHPPYYN